jgi:hypothetical protein
MILCIAGSWDATALDAGARGRVTGARWTTEAIYVATERRYADVAVIAQAGSA